MEKAWKARLARYKRSSLFVLIVGDEERTSHNNDNPGASVIKKFIIADDGAK